MIVYVENPMILKTSLELISKSSKDEAFKINIQN